MFGFCNVWMCACVGFVMCGCFGNMCPCIYCVLYCFVYVHLLLFVTTVSTTATERNSIAVNNNNNKSKSVAWQLSLENLYHISRESLHTVLRGLRTTSTDETYTKLTLGPLTNTPKSYIFHKLIQLTRKKERHKTRTLS
jgi:hypothetical protein